MASVEGIMHGHTKFNIQSETLADHLRMLLKCKFENFEINFVFPSSFIQNLL